MFELLKTVGRVPIRDFVWHYKRQFNEKPRDSLGKNWIRIVNNDPRMFVLRGRTKREDDYDILEIKEANLSDNNVARFLIIKLSTLVKNGITFPTKDIIRHLLGICSPQLCRDCGRKNDFGRLAIFRATPGTAKDMYIRFSFVQTLIRLGVDKDVVSKIAWLLAFD